MSKIAKYQQYLKKTEESAEYWSEGAVLDFTEELAEIMTEIGMSRSDLAKTIGTSKAYVTKVFSGQANFTIETMAKLGAAVNHAVRLHLVPYGMHTFWIDRRIDDGVVTYDSGPVLVSSGSLQAPNVKWTEASSNG